MTHIILKNVTKTYLVDSERIDAVSNISIEIEKGEFLSVVGHSGSGKTTLISIIGGIVKPTSGTVLYEGRDISSFDSSKLSEYRCEKIGFMFQFASLFQNLTSKENVLLPIVFRTHRNNIHEDEKKAAELLKTVGLEDKINAYPSQLSGGQQRRVAIARAFINNPELILADEPTGDLDEETEAEMMQYFKKMNTERGTTFIMVTHNTVLARQANRQLSMDRPVR